MSNIQATEVSEEKQREFVAGSIFKETTTMNIENMIKYFNSQIS